MEVGIRVVRGPDWKWDQQDGGEGCVGTVTEIGVGNFVRPPQGTVVVLWDCGYRSNYRIGYNNCYDLRVYDNAQVGICHPNVICNECKSEGFFGIRYKCLQCVNVDLCLQCYMTDHHDLTHKFQMFQTQNCSGIEVMPRLNSQKVTAKGIFVGATVVRGANWEWDNQDGGTGTYGKVLCIRGWDKESNRSVANIVWSNGRSNVYRIGHRGKVDLKCFQESVGLTYYVQHLPVLGKDTSPFSYTNNSKPSDSVFQAGDRVRVTVDKNELKRLQTVHHGGWNPRMNQLIGAYGMVHRVTERGDVRVQFEGVNNRWTFHPDAVKKCHKFEVNDMVCIIHDTNRLRELQEGHGEWLELIGADAGKVGKVVKLYSDGDLRVTVDKNTWTLNPMCVEPYVESTNVLSDSITSNRDVVPENDLLNGNYSEDVLNNYLMREISLGNLQNVTAYFDDHPERVNLKTAGKTCLHVACHEGRLDVIKYLLSKGATLNVADEDGDVELHYATYGDQSQVLEELLTNYPVNVNSVNKRLCSPLHIAANKMFFDCIIVLLKNGANVNLQDAYGDTVLHDAIGKDNLKMVNLLCAQPNLNFSLTNKNGFNILHHAALRGNKNVMEKLLENSKLLVNVKKDDGYSPLHLACLNGHLDVVVVLIETGNADIELMNDRQQTPLHLTIYQGSYSIMEVLVSLGVNVNAQDDNGDTPLHYVFQKKIFSPDEKLEQCRLSILSNVYNQMTSQYDHVENKLQIAVACLLINYGASLNIANKSEVTCSDLIAEENVICILQSWEIKRTLAAQISSRGGDPQTSDDVASSSEYCKPVPAECRVCSELANGNVTFSPCGHKIACEDCSSRMKKCLECGVVITKRITDDSRIISGSSRQPSAERLRYLERKIAEIEEVHTCPICMERRKTVVFLCGHGSCSVCATTLKSCHMCRHLITQKINIY